MSYYTINKIHPWLYSIYDPLNVYCYLIVGDDKALLFDTGYGIASLQDTISEVTDKPVIVVLGHGHVDHVNGAYQFDEAWLHEADFDLFHAHSSEDWRRNIAEKLDPNATPQDFDPEAYITADTNNLKKLDVGYVFDLGGIHVEIVGMEGHSAGSVGILIQEHRVLIDSDSANNHIWMFLPESLPISRYITMLERTLGLEFDTFFIGHSSEPRPKSELQKYIQVAHNASKEKSEPYEMLPELNGFIYKEDDIAIVFSDKTLH